jgi:prepilin-type N-terminal cleavage/methylation domain-containing protein
VTAKSRDGFTIIEIMVAVLVLGIGITALVGSSALVTRQIGRGRTISIANEIGTQRLERLRVLARPSGATAACAQAGFASSAAPDTVRGVIESWTVSGAGNSRTVTVNVSYPRKSGWSTFSLQAVVGCY